MIPFQNHVPLLSTQKKAKKYVFGTVVPNYNFIFNTLIAKSSKEEKRGEYKKIDTK